MRVSRSGKLSMFNRPHFIRKKRAQGTGIINKDMVWLNEYYVLEDKRDVHLRHHTTINSLIKEASDNHIWYGFGCKEDAYNAKEVLQIDNQTKVDRDRQASFI